MSLKEKLNDSTLSAAAMLRKHPGPTWAWVTSVLLGVVGVLIGLAHSSAMAQIEENRSAIGVLVEAVGVIETGTAVRDVQFVYIQESLGRIAEAVEAHVDGH